MIEKFDFETYLSISPNELGIYLFDINNYKNLYEKKIKIENFTNLIDQNLLNYFLEKNIFKIEKLTGKFVKNIFLIIENNNIEKVSLGVKKKNYNETISKKFLENIITDANDLFRENYQDIKIMHILVNKHLLNDKFSELYKENLRGDYSSLELEFRFIYNSFAFEIENVLEKFQIKAIRYLDGVYIKNYFKDKNLDISEMAFEIKSGCNLNEVSISPKKHNKNGIFEKFFQLFS